MEMLSPEEFFERVGVRVPDNVIRNLEERRMLGSDEVKVVSLSPLRCVEECYLDRPTGVMWHWPGCPRLGQLGLLDP